MKIMIIQIYKIRTKIFAIFFDFLVLLVYKRLTYNYNIFIILILYINNSI